MIREDEATKLKREIAKLNKQLKKSLIDTNKELLQVNDKVLLSVDSVYIRKIDYDTIVSLIQDARTAIINIKDRLKVIETKLEIK
jgi:hypothetical protein